MLTWLAVFNKAVAAVVLAEGVTHMQLHDYHGALSLQYLPEELPPAVVYVAHNAHYDATFPISTPKRKRQVYEHLNLTPEAAPLTEHNGALDVLRGAVMHMRQRQQGCGVVAVSPRYAAQISKKLSCFWGLVPLGRPGASLIRGITNALDPRDSLAAAGMSLDAVLALKASCKVQLQQLYGLAPGQQYSLATFVGRMTQQKGCDVIAEAAQALMMRYPLLQLVVVGPAGDPIGSAAAKLAALSRSFPGRMFCPLDRYVAGGEKELLLRATDFCLLPSRFEPCGFVDIEFGWAGCLVIGHDTGGLGKMPGVYFTAQASHLAHLARKFKNAVDEAMALTVSARHSMAAQALAKRFPVNDMMGAYADTWQQVDRCFNRATEARLEQQQQQERAASFFANKWQRCNKGTAAGTCAAAAPKDTAVSAFSDQSCTTAGHARSGGSGNNGYSSSIDNGPVPLECSAFFNWNRCGSSSSSQLQQLPPPAGGGAVSHSGAHLSRAQRLTNRLLVALQPFALGPGNLLLSFVLLEEVLVRSKPVCGLPMQNNLLTWLPRGMSLLAPSFIGFFVTSTGFAPLWFWLAAKVKPAAYIRTAALAVAASYLLAFVALYATAIISLAVGLVGVSNMVAAPIMSMGLLGQEEAEVFELLLAVPRCGHLRHLALVLTGFLVVAVTESLAVLAAFQAIAFSCSAAAVLWNWRALASRAAELHLNAALLLLAGLPLYQALTAAVLLARLPTGVTLGVCAVLDVAMGGHSSILGLAGFVALPSREVVSMWQFLGIMIGSVSTTLLVGVAYAAQQAALTASSWLLFKLICGCEVLRGLLVLLLARRYPHENLSAP
ncbi:hypothetical protein OEZ86_000130 [Tetradesmus obliquus]|nr:hypothetical protein OEZ86_000130 [Tetradesmus obliquus]